MLTIILISFIGVSFFGVILHFTHGWFKKGVLLHIFSAINESVWEHNKLAFYPVLVTVIIQSYLSEFSFKGFWGVAFITVFSSVALIPLLYYPIRFIIGKEIPAISISLYFVCIAITFTIEYILVYNKVWLMDDIIAQIGITIMFLFYAVFTYFPPKLGMFKDPIYNKYGEFK